MAFNWLHNYQNGQRLCAHSFSFGLSAYFHGFSVLFSIAHISVRFFFCSFRLVSVRLCECVYAFARRARVQCSVYTLASTHDTTTNLNVYGECDLMSTSSLLLTYYKVFQLACAHFRSIVPCIPLHYRVIIVRTPLYLHCLWLSLFL